MATKQRISKLRLQIRGAVRRVKSASSRAGARLKAAASKAIQAAPKAAGDQIKGAVRDAITAIIVIGVLAVATVALWNPVQTWWHDYWAPEAKGTHFSILVAQLEGDEKGAQTRHIIQSLEEQFSHTGGAVVHILSDPEVLNLGRGEVSTALVDAERQGRQWLRSKNADMLIWGSVGGADKVLRLRFLAREGQTGGASAKGYVLNDVLELPQDFGADLGVVLAVTAAAGIQPVYDDAGHVLAAVIEPVMKKLAPLATNPPASFSGDTKARIWHAYAAGERRLGEERGDSMRLQTAVTYYRKALGALAREHTPLDWARTQNNLGDALRTLSEWEGGTGRLEEAVAAYRAALEERTRERVPLDWAETQNNLGIALAALGRRESGTARLEEAVAAHRLALEERTRERVPLDWARTQVNLGVALWRLGERESGTARLEEAVAAYRAALEEYTRERAPLHWAATQGNLGLALWRLGERESGTARLGEAVAAFRLALEEWTLEAAPYWHDVAQKKLSQCLALLDERRKR